jgi:hypothetical protein
MMEKRQILSRRQGRRWKAGTPEAMAATCRPAGTGELARTGGPAAARAPRASRLARIAAAALLAGAAGVGALCVDAALAAGGGPVARAAHELSIKDEGHLHFVQESGSELLEEGPTTGTLPGSVKVRFDIAAKVSASFTIYPRGGGSISGHGNGALHSTGTYATFGGSLAVTSGTGRYAHAHGSGGLYGAIDRHTLALTVQTIGRLYY